MLMGIPEVDLGIECVHPPLPLSRALVLAVLY